MEKEKKIKFENKKLNSEKFPKDFSYINLAMMCFNTTPPQGITLTQMSDRIDALKIYRAADGKKDLQVTVKELNALIAVVSGMSWKVVDENIPEFDKYINGLKELF